MGRQDRIQRGGRLLTDPVWKLSDEETAEFLERGYTLEDIEKIQSYLETDYRVILHQLCDGLDEEEFRLFFKTKYGLDHICVCPEDIFEDNYVQMTRCKLDLLQSSLDHMDKLVQDRDSLILAVEDLRRQVQELGEEPRA